MKNLVQLLSVFLQSAAIIQGQSISTLTTPHPVQATNSTVVITATVSPPSWIIGFELNWVLDWVFNGVRVAQVGYAPFPKIVKAVDSENYFGRISVSASSASNFTSQLTITQLKADEDGYKVKLGDTSTSQSIVLTIRDCNSSLPYDVILDATSRIFNSPGKFACSNEGELFYSNGTMLTSSDTTCLESAEWSGQDNLQCWTAPIVTLASSSIDGDKLTVVEGSDLTVTCNYDDVIPAGDSSRFYIGENRYTVTKGEPITMLFLQRSDSNKELSCQAATAYTDLYPASGMSLIYTLDVLYTSSSVINKIETSQFVIEASESNYLLRSDQQLTMNCTPSDANPPATCRWQLCSDSRCQTLTSDGGCLITVDLNASSNVTCAAGNRAGNTTSAEQTVDVIQLERQIWFNVNGINLTNDGNKIWTTYLGDSVTISCRVLYQNELNTTYSITLPNNTIIPRSSVKFPSVSYLNRGEYICKTNDQFGHFRDAITLDVIYAAQQYEITTCSWNVGQDRTCSIVFFSNPTSKFVTVTKQGSLYKGFPAINDGPNVIKHEDVQQNFEFHKTHVNISDNGTYTLVVRSSDMYSFPNNVPIVFRIMVVDISSDIDNSRPIPSLGAIIGIICVSAVFIIFMVKTAYAVCKWRKTSGKKDVSRDIKNHDIDIPLNAPARTNRQKEEIQLGQSCYVEFSGNDSLQNDEREKLNEEIESDEDEDGYLVVAGSNPGQKRSRASSSHLSTDNAGYLILSEEFACENDNQGHAASNSTHYENVGGDNQYAVIASNTSGQQNTFTG
ncbi:unnamed protein product [Clavelina lepadiformis]|uniref:Immunoglobulin domain-containing protein n=1 Tax=Clavelina lepadiformis TaxID=159417 RepID=A0ABP0FCI9_CLALP